MTEQVRNSETGFRPAAAVVGKMFHVEIAAKKAFPHSEPFCGVPLICAREHLADGRPQTVILDLGKDSVWFGFAV